MTQDKAIEPTEANGYIFGRPAGRAVERLDNVIESAIQALPYATRLYPEVYAWRITEAVLAALASGEDQRGHE